MLKTDHGVPTWINKRVSEYCHIIAGSALYPKFLISAEQLVSIAKKNAVRGRMIKGSSRRYNKIRPRRHRRRAGWYYSFDSPADSVVVSCVVYRQMLDGLFLAFAQDAKESSAPMPWCIYLLNDYQLYQYIVPRRVLVPFIPGLDC